MQEKSTELLEQLLQSYQSYFDISGEAVYEGLPVAAEAEFHSRSEKYVLLKKAQLWAAEAHEYVFFVMSKHLDAGLLESYREAILKEGLTRVKPMKDHMYTYITLIVITEGAEDGIREKLRRMRYHKSYRLSIYGWSDLRVAVYDTGTGSVMTNPAGRDLEKMFRSVTDKKRRVKR